MLKLLLILGIGCFISTAGAIEITNHKHGSTVRYPVVLLRGTLSKSDEAFSIKSEGTPISPLTRDGKFKALVELKEGRNVIKLTHGIQVKEFPLTYEPQKNPYYIRLIWLTDKSGDTTYATPSDDEPQDYEGRLRTAAQLMQTFTAERMGDLAFGKKTFRLERNDAGQIVVHTLKGHLSADEYYALGDTNQYWGKIHQWLNKNHPAPFAKNIVLTSFTRKDEATGKMRGHTALGGGNLGLFGSASIFTWPKRLQEVNVAFANGAFVDPKRVHNDGAGRDTYWGVASTTIGATLHEMGHTFGLPHCKDSMGIMTRGFDHFHRVFNFHDTASRRNLKPNVFTPDQEAYFAPVSASFLKWSPWFQLDEPESTDTPRPKIQWDGKTATVSSEKGIPWVGIWADDNIHDYRVTEESPLLKEVTIPLADLKSRLGDKPLSRISTIDGAGRHAVLKIEAKKKP